MVGVTKKTYLSYVHEYFYFTRRHLRINSNLARVYSSHCVLLEESIEKNVNYRELLYFIVKSRDGGST